jgi:hypothetical protein
MKTTKERDTIKALNFAYKCIYIPKDYNNEIQKSIHKRSVQGFLDFKHDIIQNEDKDWYDWHQQASRISPGLGNVDTIAKGYSHYSHNLPYSKQQPIINSFLNSTRDYLATNII